MPDTSQAQAGWRDALPVTLAILPFGAVYGAVAADTGLDFVQAVGFSMLVYGGSSQFVALQLIGLGAPVWSVLLSIVTVNFRHVLYSASIGRRFGRFNALQQAAAFFLLVDPSFAAAEGRAEHEALTKTYYFTFGLVLYVGWAAASALGFVFGGLIADPRAFGLDFVLPVYFLVTLAAFRARPGFVPVVLLSAATTILVHHTIGSPWHVLLGAAGGIGYAAWRTPALRSDGEQTTGEQTTATVR